MYRLLADNFIIITALMSVLWIVSLRLRDASIVDPCWGIGFIIIAATSLLKTPTSISPRTWLLVGLVALWGVRLSTYLAWRSVHHNRTGQREDRRYAEMREYHGKRFWIVSLFTVFWLQAAIMWFVSSPVQIGIYRGSLLRDDWSITQQIAAIIGILFWCMGIVFETAGDWQLARFKADPSNVNRVCDRGLWRYTRHPNYFGDFCVWWGVYLVAAATGAWWTVVSPLLMSFLLMRVSGVTLLESTIVERRPAYREYVVRTNAFFPGPPRI